MAEGATGVILAGGASRRMGQDKACLPWGRTTLLEHVMETVRPWVDELIVVVKDARAFQCLNARVAQDLVPDAHALGGIYTGLTLSASKRCFVCACDMPFLNPPLIQFLIAQTDGYDVVMPRTAHGLQPLHAVYATSALPVIETHLRDRQWDLKALVPRLRAKVIEPEVIAAYDSHGMSWLNLNTQAEYTEALVLHPPSPEAPGVSPGRKAKRVPLRSSAGAKQGRLRRGSAPRTSRRCHGRKPVGLHDADRDHRPAQIASVHLSHTARRMVRPHERPWV